MTYKNPEDTIMGYRRRRGRTVPIIFAGLSILLLTGGVVLAVSWWANGGAVALVPTSTPVPPTATSVPPSPTALPSATPVPSATPSPTPPGEYAVQAGDTLAAIAERFNVDLLTLMALNNITDPTQLSVGQVLKIPEPDAPMPSRTPLPTNLRPGSKIVHVVQPGENLQFIASLYNSTVEAIIKENDLTDPNKIQVGQSLSVPVNLVTPTPTVPTPVSASSTPTRAP